MPWVIAGKTHGIRCRTRRGLETAPWCHADGCEGPPAHDTDGAVAIAAITAAAEEEDACAQMMKRNEPTHPALRRSG